MEGFPGGSDSKESTCKAGDPGSVPGLGKSPGEGNDHLLQYSCLGNPMDRGAWQATVHGVARVRHNLATDRPWYKTTEGFYKLFSGLNYLTKFHTFLFFTGLMGLIILPFHSYLHKTKQKPVVRCYKVGGSDLTIFMLPGLRTSSILVKGNANLLSFHATPIHIFKGDWFHQQQQWQLLNIKLGFLLKSKVVD